MSRKVLVIDDSEPVFETVRDELAKERVELRLARDRQGGLVVAEEWLPDLILLDGELADGPIEIIRALKNAALTQDIPVMLLTDVRSEQLRSRAFEMGASDSISIPIDPAELRARVRAALHTRRLAELLTRKAMVDGLTGLWNRTYFDTRLSAQTSFARRSGTSFACVLMDIDGFSSINQRFGRHIGDALLMDLARLVQENCRQEDIACRLGGDAFSIIVPNSKVKTASALAERLRGVIAAQQGAYLGQRLDVTCSFGVADVKNTADLLDVAAKALDMARRAGGNRVQASET